MRKAILLALLVLGCGDITGGGSTNVSLMMPARVDGGWEQGAFLPILVCRYSVSLTATREVTLVSGSYSVRDNATGFTVSRAVDPVSWFGSDRLTSSLSSNVFFQGTGSFTTYFEVQYVTKSGERKAVSNTTLCAAP